jgi:hypothetical protein
VVLILAMMLSAVLTPVAQASKLRTYRGRTSQPRSGPVYFLIVRTSDGLGVRDFDFEFRLTCEDGSRFRYGTGYGYGRSGYPLDGHQLEIRTQRLRVTGTFGPQLAFGAARFKLRRHKPGGGRQICTTGNITWGAHRVAA